MVAASAFLSPIACGETWGSRLRRRFSSALKYVLGVGARLVASLGSFPGVHQAIPAPDPVTGMVAATNWTKTTTLTIPSDWVTGVYLARLNASSGNKSTCLR